MKTKEEQVRLAYQAGVKMPLELEPVTEWPVEYQLSLSPPEFMAMAFVGLYGGNEEVVIQARSMAAFLNFYEENKFKQHSRFIQHKLFVNGKEVRSWSG